MTTFDKQTRGQMSVLLTGGKGLLGAALESEARTRGLEVVCLGRSELNVKNPARCVELFEHYSPDIVLHCAAYAAVEQAELHPLEAFAVNEAGARNVVRAAAKIRAKVVYPSTDHVFGADGRDRPWSTDDRPDPRGAYARSKLAGEAVVRAASPKHLVIRTGWLYGYGGANFVDTVLRVAREKGQVEAVEDQVGRPTWSASLARCVFDLIDGGAEGTYHASDGGTATRFELAQAAVTMSGLDASVVPVSTAAFGSAAPRPAYSALDIERTEHVLGRRMPHWRVSLRQYVEGSANPTRAPALAAR